METGTLSGWLARALAKLGNAVDVIDARQAHAVMRLQHNKTDANDAELLAEIAAAKALVQGGALKELLPERLLPSNGMMG